MLVEIVYLDFSYSRAWLFALLTFQVYIFLIKTLVLDKNDRYYIVSITEYKLFQGFGIPWIDSAKSINQLSCRIWHSLIDILCKSNNPSLFLFFYHLFQAYSQSQI